MVIFQARVDALVGLGDTGPDSNPILPMNEFPVPHLFTIITLFLQHSPQTFTSPIFGDLYQTVFLLVYAELAMSIFIMIPWLGFDIHFVLFTCITVLALVAHTRCQFTDPGSVPDYILPPNLPHDIQFDKLNIRPYSPPKMCRSCRTLKTRRTFHCNSVGRCIVNLDHFCVWCNNSIGALNHRWFFQFLFYTALSCVYVAALLITRFIGCNSNPHMCEMTSMGTLFGIITFIESLVFGFFTMMMLYDQYSGVLEEQFRGEEHYKAQLKAYEAAMQTDAKYFSDPPVAPPQKSTYELFQEVFGGPFGISWLNPFTRPDAIFDYFQNELLSCVHDADKVTQKFVHFAYEVQNGKIILESQRAQAEEEGDYDAELSEGDFEEDDLDENENNTVQRPNSHKPPQQSDQSADKVNRVRKSNSKAQKLD